jgi:hypothetical protein
MTESATSWTLRAGHDVRTEVPLRLALACTLLAGALAPAAGQSSASVSTVTLGGFLLEPAGILFAMHPTDARITIGVTAAAPLEVCELGTTFSRNWTGGCRRLEGRPLELPTSGGAVHIGFRVLPANGRATRIVSLRVRWHCVDRYFALLHGSTVVGRARPSFDCG